MTSKMACIMLISILMGFSAFSQEIILMNSSTNDSTINLTGCSALLYDSGGPDGNYGNGENYSVTICIPDGYPMLISVTINTESSSYDYLTIYEGTSTSGTPIAYRLGGSLVLDPNSFLLSTSCATFVWHSDESANRSGFEIEINCQICQDYTVAIVSDAQYDDDDNYYFGCSGASFSAQIDFPHNNETYEQTIENTSFLWYVFDNKSIQSYEGMGLDELTDSLDPGAYAIRLTTTDANRCTVVSEDVYFNISVPPTFVGTTASSDVYLGTEVSLIGVVNPIESRPSEIHDVYNNEQICLVDNTYLEWSICLSVTDFTPGQSIQSETDIESIGMQIEHSWMGELDIIIQCPNGQSMTLFNRSCRDGYFGEPIDYDEVGVNSSCDGPEWVGIGYDYYWTPENNNGLMSANCPGTSIPLPAGNYQPVDSFSNLIGCPLNGEWCILIWDELDIDDGTVFRTEIHFSDNITPAPSFQNTFGNEMWWEGEALQYEGMRANNIAIPTTLGQVEYTFSATDNFGCTYDTTLYVNVLPAGINDEISGDEILVFPNPVNDMLTITSSEVISEIEIVNDRGQIVRRMDVNGNTAVCNVSELASGVYVVRIYTIRPFTSTGSVSEAHGAGSVIERKFVKE